jgi:glycine cleavage system H protein
MRPKDILFAQTHEWVKEDNNIATIGITDFAVQQLSDLVYIDFPKVGQVVKKGEPFGEVESVKTVSDLLSPVSGEVIEVNDSVSSNLDSVSKDPFGIGWLVKVKMNNPSDLSGLLTSDSYDKHCEEGH